jgi:hypothetical protein
MHVDALNVGQLLGCLWEQYNVDVDRAGRFWSRSGMSACGLPEAYGTPSSSYY